MRAVKEKLQSAMGRAIKDFSLIENGDRIMVAMSGGKDSYALFDLLADLKPRAPVSFELLAVHLDQGQPGYDGEPLRLWLHAQKQKPNGVDYHIEREDTYSIVIDKVSEGKTYCSLCSRLRRGVLYGLAERFGCNKLALGHHRDDTIETLLLNVLYSGKIAAMPARLKAQDYPVTVIRPLIYCHEEWLEAFAAENRYPILPCNLCGSQSQAQRRQVKELIGTLHAANPQVKGNLLAALGNVVDSHLLVPTAAGREDKTAHVRTRLPILDSAER